MPTTVHIPTRLLAAVDRRARKAQLSRNGFIVRALERAVAREDDWSPGFLERLAATGARDAEAVDEMLAVIRRRRTRKGPPRL